MDYTFNRLVTGASFDEVDARARKSLADNWRPVISLGSSYAQEGRFWFE